MNRPLRIDFPPELPISAQLPALRAAIAAHQVTIVCGATGSGKSTQLPKLCLAEGYAARGRIGHTQPRRLAARTIAERIAVELDVTVGEEVGFQTRFERQLGARTRLKLMTDGVLLQEIHRDRSLRAYDLLIVDEVHERSVNIDLLLGYLRRILPRRPELRLVLTSATIDAARFASFFAGAACLEIPGHTFPVEVRYRAPATLDDYDLGTEVLGAIAELDRVDRGDVLVFLPGERAINEVREVLAGAHLRGTRFLPLYARLGSREQRQVFAPHRERHIVLATNVAETSVTVPGVRHVIDSGLARLASYSPRSKLQRLPVARISQASAAQRRGRCGRERPGICVRLYGEDDFARRPAHTPPELQRSNLAAVVLKLADLGLGRLDDFPLLDPPDPRAIQDGYALLQELDALDDGGRLTAIGRCLARLPLDPRLGRMVAAAASLGSLREVLVIVAALSAGDIREEPPGARSEASAAHARFVDRRSDFLWYLNARPEVGAEFRALGRRRQIAFCRERYWSWRRVREWLDTHAEIAEAAHTLGWREQATPASYRAIHGALLTGLLGRVGRLEAHDRYVGTRNSRFRLHPASALRARPPGWVMAAEIVETTAPYARIAAKTEAAWIEQVGAKLVRRSHAVPEWDPARGQAMVLEDVSLYGLTLSSGRRIPLGPIDRHAARELLLRDGLVHGALGAEPDFLAHNRTVIGAVRDAEARVRRRDLLADDTVLVAFYAARLPPAIDSRRDLLAWLREEPGRDAALRMTAADVTRAGVGEVAAYLFPSVLAIRGAEYALSYVFEPGTEEDGVTITLPIAALAQVSAADFDRLVPGFLRDEVFALLKSLPKVWRRKVSPLAEFANALTTVLDETSGALVPALASAIARMTGVRVPMDAFRAELLPTHLTMRYRLVDERGDTLATGRDLAALRRTHREAAAAAFERAKWNVPTQVGATWIFGVLPENVDAAIDGLTCGGYPALEARPDAVAIRVHATPEGAARAHRDGVIRLLALGLPQEVKHLRRTLKGDARLLLRATAFGWTDLAGEIIDAAIGRCLPESPLPRNAAAFDDLRARVQRALVPAAVRLREELAAVLDVAAEITARLAAEAARVPAVAERDLTAQLRALIEPGMLVRVPAERLNHYPRYLRAMAVRIDRLLLEPAKDARKLAALQAALAPSAELAPRLHAADRERLHGLVEEYRVAVFAPELRTAEPVSAQRIERFLDQLASALHER